TAALAEQAAGVQVKLELEGLDPGFHGIHVHEYPKCEGPDFKSAGSHFNPEGKEHGLTHPDGARLDALANVEAESYGRVEEEVMLNDATLLEGNKSILLCDATSLVIHSDQDDGVSQPGGDAGERIACAEIKATGKKESMESPRDPTKLNGEEEEE